MFSVVSGPTNFSPVFPLFFTKNIDGRFNRNNSNIHSSIVICLNCVVYILWHELDDTVYRSYSSLIKDEMRLEKWLANKRNQESLLKEPRYFRTFLIPCRERLYVLSRLYLLHFSFSVFLFSLFLSLPLSLSLFFFFFFKDTRCSCGKPQLLIL